MQTSIHFCIKAVFGRPTEFFVLHHPGASGQSRNVDAMEFGSDPFDIVARRSDAGRGSGSAWRLLAPRPLLRPLPGQRAGHPRPARWPLRGLCHPLEGMELATTRDLAAAHVPAPALTHGARLAAIGRRPAAHEEAPGQIGSISLQAAGAG